MIFKKSVKYFDKRDKSLENITNATQGTTELPVYELRNSLQGWKMHSPMIIL